MLRKMQWCAKVNICQPDHLDSHWYFFFCSASLKLSLSKRMATKTFKTQSKQVKYFAPDVMWSLSSESQIILRLLIHFNHVFIALAFMKLYHSMDISSMIFVTFEREHIILHFYFLLYNYFITFYFFIYFYFWSAEKSWKATEKFGIVKVHGILSALWMTNNPLCLALHWTTLAVEI